MPSVVSYTDSLFGTDGIRGAAGVYPLSDGMIVKIGSGLAHLLRRKHKGKKHCSIVVGKDTRLSGQRIECILSDALNAYGINVFLAGTVPLPGLAYLTRLFKSDMGVMISASHNRPADNGIKLISEGGKKINIQDEADLEAIIVSGLIDKPQITAVKGVTRVYNNGNAVYESYIRGCLPELKLEGLRVIVDCAFGAAAGFAGELFSDFGAVVSSMHDFPSGDNINAGGVSDISHLCKAMRKTHFDIGIAVDGDGDRLMLVDEKGNILDGDHIMAIIAIDLLAKKKLAKDTLVATVASNQGLLNAIEACGGKVIRVSVGDKHVYQALIDNNLTFGGEAAGQIINLEYSSVPDAFVAALLVMKIMKETGRPLIELAGSLIKIPQVNVNIKVRERRPFQASKDLWSAINHSQQRLQGQGRLLVRYSGTEDVVRIMAEGLDERLIKEVVEELSSIMKNEIGVKELIN